MQFPKVWIFVNSNVVRKDGIRIDILEMLVDNIQNNIQDTTSILNVEDRSIYDR